MDWLKIPEKYQNGELLGYRVRYKKYLEITWHTKVVDLTTTVLTELKPYTVYYIEVAGFNTAGEGPTEYSVCRTQEGGR